MKDTPEYWEEKIRILKSDVWQAIKDHFNERQELLKEQLVIEKDIEKIKQIQAEIKVIREMQNLPQNLLSVYNANLEAVKSLNRGK